jgi:heavy metal translocating P-type ATPase
MSTIIASVCDHCGLPLRQTHLSDVGPRFCCYGCEVASHLLGKGDDAGARMAFYKLSVGVVLGINVMMFSMPLYVESLGSFFRQGLGSSSYFDLLKWLLMVLSLPVFFLLGMPFIESSVRNIKDSLRSNADVLIAIGVTAAMLVSIFDTIIGSGPVYYETAVAILVIVTAGRYLEAKARAKASRTVEELGSQIPQQTSLLDEDGTITEVLVAALSTGNVILSKPGEMIPVDCIITKGSARIGEAMLTGEAHPIDRHVGETVLAGAVNYDGLLELEVLQPMHSSFIERLKDLLIESKLKRAAIQETTDRVAAIAVPIIIAIAIGSLGYWWAVENLRSGLFAFLSVVLVACPCAIGIATPAALWVAVTEASKRGILFRSLGIVERLTSIQKIFFDKTGTVTLGKPSIKEIVAVSTTDLNSRNLQYIGAIASLSSHPLSQAIAKEFNQANSFSGSITNVSEIAARGISATIEGRTIRIGSESFVTAFDSGHRGGTTVWCSIDDAIFEISFEDAVKAEAKEVFQSLHADKYETMILSGDEQSVANRLGNELNTDAFGKLTPEDKARIVADEANAIFIGDGFNDAGAIGAAEVGIAMGSSSDLIRSEADVILFDNDLNRVPQMLTLAKQTMRIVKQNLFWAFAYNVIGVVIAAMGMLNPIIAALAMAISSLAVAQNSLRLRTEGANA